MSGRRPDCKKILMQFCGRVQVMSPACSRGTRPLALMFSADRNPIKSPGSTPMAHRSGSSDYGSTAHIIPSSPSQFQNSLRQRLSCLLPSLSRVCSTRLRSIGSVGVHDGPSDARQLVGDRDGHHLCRFLFQQLRNPRIPPGKDLGELDD